MFFKKNCIKFRYRGFETCMRPFQEGLQLHLKQKVVQHHINNEMCTLSVTFTLLGPTPVYTACSKIKKLILFVCIFCFCFYFIVIILIINIFYP
jgi:hypothetical protein